MTTDERQRAEAIESLIATRVITLEEAERFLADDEGEEEAVQPDEGTIIEKVRTMVSDIHHASERERNELPDHIVQAADELHRKFQEQDRDA